MNIKKWLKCAPLALTILINGCMKIDVSVQMKDDGSATVTEQVTFTPQLLELDRHNAKGQKLAVLLGQKQAQKRAQHMGTGASLVSHKWTKGVDGSRGCVAVYKVPKIEDLRLVNPYLNRGPPGQMLKLNFRPIYKVVNSDEALGHIMLSLGQATPSKRRPGKKGAVAPPPPTPRDLQILRELKPVVADMFSDLEIAYRLKTARPLSRGYVRNWGTSTHTIDLLSFSHLNMDKYGAKFINNEELMLSLLRFRFGEANLADHTANFARNETIPVYRASRAGSRRFRIAPSKYLFKKYFAGRPKAQGGDK